MIFIFSGVFFLRKKNNFLLENNFLFATKKKYSAKYFFHDKKIITKIFPKKIFSQKNKFFLPGESVSASPTKKMIFFSPSFFL